MPKYRSTSRQVISTHTSFLPDGTVRTQTTKRGPRDIAQSQSELRLRRGALFQRSSALEREILNNFSPVPAAFASPVPQQSVSTDHDMGDDTGWETAPEDSPDVYTELAAGVTQVYGHQITPRRPDVRTRRDRVERRNEAWEIMYPTLTDMHLQYEQDGVPPMEADQCHPPIQVFELFEMKYISFPLFPEQSLVVTMARYGYIATAPLHPSSAVSSKALELFRVLSCRCPQLGIQPFVKALCELHQVTYRPSLRTQLSIAFDAYLNIYGRIQSRINFELGRGDSKRRLQNACAPCTYKLQDEPPLDFNMLLAIDGNESLKRVQRGHYDRQSAGKAVSSDNAESIDSRVNVGDMYVLPTTVDHFKNEVRRRTSHSLPEDSDNPPPPPHEFQADTEEGRPTDGPEEPTPCTQRWTNLADESTKKRLGIFHETGLFLAVCRHGTALIMCDMIQSGELAKYPLAITNELIDMFGTDLMIGYDIGCGFSVTANRSALLGPKLRTCRARYCVGSFHGHAHCRLCQLDWHPMYIKGTGLEDFETCERVFSRSNALAMCTRHASTFHRKQLIHRWFETWNFDRYSEISQFLYNNYVQALNNIQTLPHEIAEAMRGLRIPTVDVFEQWRAAEKAYLTGLRIEPEEEILKMEYVETLIKLQAANDKWEQSTRAWMSADLSQLQGSTGYSRSQAKTRRLEAMRSRGLDSILTLQKAVQDLEDKLEIDERWTQESPQWKTAVEMVETRKYRRAVDHLEGLVVARLLELTKAHQSGTGVKLRRHIAKALAARSQAIRTAVKNYNTAALSLRPPRPTLEIDMVLNHVYLGQFDILRDSRGQVWQEPWAQAAEREAAAAFFKVQRSREELRRLDVEVRRLRTYIDDEERLLSFHAQRLQETHPELAFQINKKLQHLVSVNMTHRRRLNLIEGLDGFTGTKGAGIREGHVCAEGGDDEVQDHNVDLDLVLSEVDSEEAWLDDENEAVRALDSTFHTLSVVE